MTQMRGIASGLVVAFAAILCVSVASSQLDPRVQSKTPDKPRAGSPIDERVQSRVETPRHDYKKRHKVKGHKRVYKHDNGLHLGQRKHR